MNRNHKYLIGLDLGTSAIKGMVMSSFGTVLSIETVQTEYLDNEDNRYVQFDADNFYSHIVSVIRRLVSALPENSLIAGISMASASGNTMLINREGKPMMPAISWLDTRVTDEMERVFEKLADTEVREITGWPLLNMFPLAHLSWLKCHRSDMLEKADKVCMSTEYINYRLTGKWGIDTSTATAFYLQDQKAGRWYLPYLQKLGISETKLPVIHAPGTVLGYITSEASLDTGMEEGTPVLLGSFDHPCAARGSGVTEEGQVLISCGTSWVGFLPVKERRKALEQKMLADPFLSPKGNWGAMFSLPAIGKNIDKYVRKYISDIPGRYDEFDNLAASVDPGARGLRINLLSDDIQLDIGSYSKAEIARAVMEGTAFLLKGRLDFLIKAGFCVTSAAMAGGPSETFPWPQIVSDMIGMNISIINGACAGSAGAAVLAGIGTGIFSDVRDAFNKAAFKKTILKPDMEVHNIYSCLYQ